ncbi:MAG: ferrochelatase [Acidimicrobiales bacterium]
MIQAASAPESQATVGVVVMAYGTPRRLEDVESYYTHVRRGRPPTPELLENLVTRYQAIGGISPLAQRTEAQANGLQAALNERDPGRYLVGIGLKHAEPFIEECVDRLITSGISHLIGLVLAPHFSSASVGEYLGRMKARAVMYSQDVTMANIENWHLEPSYIRFLADEVKKNLSKMPKATKVLFTAHSLPQRVIDAGNTYPDQLRATGEAVAKEVGLNPWSDWAVAWQSAGRTPEPWIGPDILHVIGDLAETGRANGVLVCPCGFVSDHLEVLYDLDIEAAAVAEKNGLAFARTAVPNDDPLIMGALADLVIAANESPANES